jgi:hypothetical protein
MITPDRLASWRRMASHEDDLVGEALLAACDEIESLQAEVASAQRRSEISGAGLALAHRQQTEHLADRDRAREIAVALEQENARQAEQLVNEARANEWAERLTHQTCSKGKHAEWWVDSEYDHACPWCRIAALEQEAARLTEESARLLSAASAAYGLPPADVLAAVRDELASERGEDA